MLQRCMPGSGTAPVSLNSYLNRPPWKHGRNPIKEPNSAFLISRLGKLVSSKGNDILLTSATEPVQSFDRLRTSLPPHLWSWKVVCGWHWKYNIDPEGPRDHINRLELRSVLTSIRWRVQKQQLRNKRFLHMGDSLVSLHVLNKGRSSSRQLRSIVQKISALLLLSHSLVILGYVESSVNPADAPSRRGKKRKWENAL